MLSYFRLKYFYTVDKGYRRRYAEKRAPMDQHNNAGAQNPYICSFCGFNNTSFVQDFRPHFGGDPRRKQVANIPYASQAKNYYCHKCGKLNTIASS
jgi:predicted RNA-binding Zn-ribbon protein involved in translation (DUF1610 family)